MQSVRSLTDGFMGSSYGTDFIRDTISGFQRDPRSQVDFYPPLLTTGRDEFNINKNPNITMGQNAMNDPNYFKQNELYPEGPLPFFRDRNGAQLNTDWHLPSGLFRQNRHETFTEELFGPPSCRYNPEVYGNGAFHGRTRNYVTMADKLRGANGAYNNYVPLDDEYPGAIANGGPAACSVDKGFSNGMQQTERRRVNYDLARVPYSEEMLRNLVPLNAPIENVFANRLGGTSSSYLGLGSMYNPELHMPYTHGGTGKKHYWKNEGVHEVNPRFVSHRPKWVGYQQVRAEFGNPESVMRPQARSFIDNGIRSAEGLYGTHN